MSEPFCVRCLATKETDRQRRFVEFGNAEVCSACLINAIRLLGRLEKSELKVLVENADEAAEAEFLAELEASPDIELNISDEECDEMLRKTLAREAEVSAVEAEVVAVVKRLEACFSPFRSRDRAQLAKVLIRGRKEKQSE